MCVSYFNIYVMIITECIKKLCKNINFVLDVKSNKKYTGEFKPVLYKHIYSSSNSESIRLENNGEILPLKDIKVEYVCPNCKNVSFILLKKFLSKLSLKCSKCREDDEKRKKQSDYIKKTYKEFGKIKAKAKIFVKKFNQLSTDELIEISKKEFESEIDSFKEEYFKKVPTIEEFNKIKDKIQIDNINMNNVKYYPYIKTSHSRKYSPKVLDEKEVFHLLYKIKYKCDCCGSEYEGRNFKEKSSQYKLLCKGCNLSNKTFKVRSTTNIRNEKIVYQSVPELDLIKYCNVNSILIQNGPMIPYNFMGKKLKYKVDFKIKNILIEIKDNHIWHRNEILSGKWGAKESAAIEYSKKNNLEYRLIMKEDVKKLKDDIVRFFWSK